MFWGYYTLVLGIKSIFLETVWVPLNVNIVQTQVNNIANLWYCLADMPAGTLNKYLISDLKNGKM